ncbi:hypothetical protein [Lactococcus lactis]|uniref:hypothetical protein n=1 Tax=Lactococcus lactis TaxID=1358 RepID=UPI00067D8714|nr:hypothetical protein [Lactococcus lactis]OJH47563.1 hypothetical protein LGL2_04935 [Lactococcus lactis subsp. lactis bv. diacetylactis]
MIKTEHDKVLTLYCQDQKIITNGKLLRVELGLPYQIMSFRYVGESSTEYTRGDFYNVIDCGPHWHTNEIVVWVTNNGHPETTDVDYCTAFSFDAFLSDFEYDSKYLELINKVEKHQEQLNTAKNALTEIAYTRQEIWRGGTLVGFEATEDAKIAYDALAAIGWDGCPVGLIVKNGLTKEEIEGSDDE